MAVYYNEINKYKAAWLENLIKAGQIASGDVDTRSIEDVHPEDLKNYDQCHFFAGIGIWSYAARRAGIPDTAKFWTFSCPCQPFSAAGKRAGTADERHLWPAVYHLIRECRPPVFFGEQVASNDGLAWLDTVQTDLEEANYAIGPLDLCAAGVGGPHIRQRLYFVGMANGVVPRLERYARYVNRAKGRAFETGPAPEGCEPVWVADATGGLERGWRRRGPGEGDRESDGSSCERPAGLCPSCSLADDDQVGRSCSCDGQPGDGNVAAGHSTPQPLADTSEVGRKRKRRPRGNKGKAGTLPDRRLPDGEQPPGPTNGFWAAADWLHCRDDKWRPVEPGTLPLADGLAPGMGSDSPGSPSPYRQGQTEKQQTPWRKGMLEGYGDGIVAELAAEFIGAACDVFDAMRQAGVGDPEEGHRTLSSGTKERTGPLLQ